MSPSSSSSSSAVTTASITGTSLMVVPAAGSCPHEIRPGTTVCLHCRKEERLARIARRRRSMARVFGLVAGVAVCGVIANAAAGAFDLRLPKLGSLPSLPSLPSLASLGDAVTARASHAPAAGHRAATTSRDAAGSGATHDSLASAAATTPIYGATDGTAAGAGLATAADAARPAVAPIVAEGRNALRGESFVAVRAGDVVTVQFDTPEARTRRADKFEAVVRATLPQLYGAAADSALAHVPAGTLVTASELVTELPARGVRLPIAGGAIVLWPETRPGRDGPLVVSYRTVVAR